VTACWKNTTKRTTKRLTINCATQVNVKEEVSRQELWCSHSLMSKTSSQNACNFVGDSFLFKRDRQDAGSRRGRPRGSLSNDHATQIKVRIETGRNCACSHSLISLSQPLPLLLPLPLPSCEMFAMSSQSHQIFTKLVRLTDFTILELETPSYTTTNQCLQITPPREDVENKSQPLLTPPQPPLRLVWCFSDEVYVSDFVGITQPWKFGLQNELGWSTK
jgi:hypothetical protein